MTIKVTCPECHWTRFREISELPMLCPKCLDELVERVDEEEEDDENEDSDVSSSAFGGTGAHYSRQNMGK